MKIGRCSGILLHVTSLPGKFGIGDLGPESRWFADFLADAKQKLWCVLPLGPTGPQNSPYQSRSTFAGNPLLISPQRLVEHGYISHKDLHPVPAFSASRVQFSAVRRYKEALLEKAFHQFSPDTDYLAFERNNHLWLDRFALFLALVEANGGILWNRFDPRVKPDPQRICYHKFVQYEFFRQWRALREYCHQRNISIMGDMPFYVEHDSADVWSHPQLFDLRKNGEPRTVGGVPPDYFSSNGQLWGTPAYRWDKLKDSGFQWWIDRFRAVLQLVDLLRLDHFRGFEAFWGIPAGASTAKNGHWIKGPGALLFRAVRRKLGDLPFIAENLGIITPEVEELRRQFGLFGMAVLQFAFDDDNIHRPNNYVRELITFTGTHDNDTTCGWWDSLRRSAQGRSRSAAREKLKTVQCYLQNDGREIHWSFIQAILTSVADIAVVPLQDVLGLGSEARMNLPGRAKGNWDWRFEKHQLTQALHQRLCDLTTVSGRSNPPR
jgi:4-alpha-glucanotransferase